MTRPSHVVGRTRRTSSKRGAGSSTTLPACFRTRVSRCAARNPWPSTESYNAPGAFKVPNGFNATCPRDILMTLGNTIIEAPMGLRSRFFEYHAYRPLIQEYFKAGSNWVTAPKGIMSDRLYDEKYPVDDKSIERRQRLAKHEYVTTEAEPIWDAADWMRMGKDIICQRSFELSVDPVWRYSVWRW
eukprot:Sspe_Gene.52485::Locus_29070_Transcript_2_2_Confidence_0.750_Length_917::g.52485::m.52485/K00613/GATM; glycine amidinotransferase